MNCLIDNILIRIFKMLNLNERTAVRLINKRFKLLCDSILIDKLIIYEKSPIKSGKLEYTNEPFELFDCVKVNNLQKFLDNQVLIHHQMRKIKILKIIGKKSTIKSENEILNEIEFNLDAKFNHLRYLSLKNIHFQYPNVITCSKQIQYLIVQNSSINSTQKYLHDSNVHRKFPLTSIHSLGIINLKTTIIKYMNFTNGYQLENGFFTYLIKNGLMNNVKELKCCLVNFEPIELLNNFCPSLRRLDCSISDDLDDFSIIAKEFNFNEFSRKLRSNLSLIIFGVQFNSTIPVFLFTFLKDLHETNNISISLDGDFRINMDQKLLGSIRLSDKISDLSEFYKRIKTFESKDLTQFDEKLFKKFINCREIDLEINKNISDDLIRNYLMVFSKLKSINIATSGDIMLKNKVLDRIPEHQIQLKGLAIDLWDIVDYGFIFKLKNLKYLILNLYHPMQSVTFLNIIRRLKNLRVFALTFMKHEKLTKEGLSKFKKQANDCLLGELKLNDYYLTVEIHSRRQTEFIRCFYRKEIYKEFDQFSKDFRDRLFDIMDYKNRPKYECI